MSTKCHQPAHYPRRLTRLIACLLLFYFAYHSLNGEKGLFAHLELNSQVLVLDKKLDQIRMEREALEKKVSMLRLESLDRDLLDERLRVSLNYAHKNDVVIILPQRNN